MAEIATQQPGAVDMAGMGTELFPRRSDVKAPEPNPEFSFPRLPQPSGEGPSDSLRKPRIRPQNLALGPVPSPELSPSNPPSLETQSNASPGRSRPLSSRGIGHRREGSQFIGGDASTTGPGLLSSSPTKASSSLPSPPSSVGRRRGHAHRRSGAMSTNDFSAFLNSSAAAAPPLPVPAVPGSAPTTPMIPSHEIPQPHLERAHSQPSMTTREKIDFANAVGAMEDQELASTPRAADSRPRVGFSEKVEVIPRPLSTISSDTASSMSTVRQSHSNTGSINSVLEQRPATPVSATSAAKDRPSSSDSIDEPFFGALEEQEVNISQRPTSASGKALFAKRRRSPPPAFSRYGDISPDSTHQAFYFASEDPTDRVSPTTVETAEVETADKDGKRESRGRSLASRLLRKARPKSKEEFDESGSAGQVSPTDAPAGLMSLDDVTFDEDTTTVIHSAGYVKPTPANYQFSPEPVKESFDKDDSAALDLDLAYNSVKIDEDSPNSFANIMKGTIRQHRRTESAPSLSPIQRQSFIPSKLPGSPHKMADVFEEEEEEDSPPRQQRPKAQSFHQPKRRAELQGLGVQIVDAEAGEGVQPRRKSRSPSFKAESATSETGPTFAGPAEASNRKNADIATDVSNLRSNPRFSMATKSSDEETITPTAMHSPPASRGDDSVNAEDATAAAPHLLDFVPPPSLAPHAHHDSSDLSSSSSIPSPNLTNVSFDGPRLNTAASSITDRTTWSSNHPQSMSTCPDLGQSTEDVPSLTSSASTMMSGHPSHVSHQSMAGVPPSTACGTSFHANTFSGMPSPAYMGVRPQSTGADRTFTFSGIAPRPRRNWGSRPSTASNSKRASLASLSRLMSKGTDSEKSKLSIAWGAQDEEGEGKKEKESKGKRLSRVLKFWKSKEKLRDAS